MDKKQILEEVRKKYMHCLNKYDKYDGDTKTLKILHDLFCELEALECGNYTALYSMYTDAERECTRLKATLEAESKRADEVEKQLQQLEQLYKNKNPGEWLLIPQTTQRLKS